jgi:glycerol-3-phosphate dehydrogenase
VVNATGPWSGCTLARTGVERPVRLAPSRGTHIHVPRRRVGHEHAFIFEAPADHRIMFVLPWREDLTLIGTTDVFHPGSPDSVAATGEDIRYLLDATNHLFPDAHLGPDDVLSAWAGLRPLLAPPPGPDGPGGTDATDPAGGKGAGAVSREFEIREEPHGVFSLLGGKLTSHRNMAEETVDRAARFLEEVEVYGDDCDTARVPLPGGDFESLDDLREALVVEAGKAGVSRAGAARLARAYGTRSSAVLDVVRDRPQLAGPIADGRPHVLAEAAYAVRREYALRLEDILYRRTRIGLETRDGVETAARRVAAVVGPELGWDRERTAREIERCLEHRSADDAAIEEARDGAGEHVAGDHVAGDHRAGDHRAGDQETPTGGTE